MSAQMLEIELWIFGAIASVLWYLLRQKDAKQQTDIDNLLKKHEEDTQRLADLSLEIAKKQGKPSG